MKTFTALLFRLCVATIVVVGRVGGQAQAGASSGASLTSTKTANATSSAGSGASVKIVDLVRFDERLHEAEFIFQFTSTKNAHLSLGNYRSLTLLRNLTLPSVNSSLEIVLQKYRFSLRGAAWQKESVPLCGELQAYEFHTKAYLSLEAPGVPGTLLVNLIIERTSGMQIFSQMYSPLITLVCVSFLTMSKKGSFTFRIWTSMACFLGLFIVTTIMWDDIPRTGENGGQTAIEHYIVICIGFVFQIILNNILIYGYLSMAKGDFDSDPEGVTVVEPSNGQNGNNKETKKSTKIKPNEMHILKMGKCHQFVYFKCLKPSKYQLPIAFLVISLIYMVIILWLTSGLPQGFQSPPAASSSNPLDFSCF